MHDIYSEAFKYIPNCLFMQAQADTAQADTEDKIMAELCKQFELHPNQITE